MAPPNTTFSQVDGGADSGQQGGFFSRLGAGLKKVMPYVTPIANRLAAAAGNYGPIELEHQQHQDALQSALTQSQLQNQDLNRQLTQKQLENYQTPEQQAERAVAIKRAETPTTYSTDNNQIGIADTDLSGNISPRMVNLPAQTVPNPTQASNAGLPPRTMPPLIPPSPTVTEAPRRVPAIMPQTVAHWSQGMDASGAPVMYEYGKTGGLVGNAPAPMPTNVAVPTSPWKAYLETGRKQGLSDGQIVDKWNSEQSQSTNIKMVPQPDGSISAIPVTQGTSKHRGLLSNPDSNNPAPPSASAGPGKTVGGHATKPVTDAFTTYNQSQERYNVMQNALGDAMKGDQQAMLNLLANHLGMTMGLQKGARMNQAIIEEAQRSTPWLQGLQARFDDRGFLSGVTLTPQQMQSMVKLAADRANQDKIAWQRAQQAQGQGFNPNATPPVMPSTSGGFVHF